MHANLEDDFEVGVPPVKIRQSLFGRYCAFDGATIDF